MSVAATWALPCYRGPAASMLLEPCQAGPAMSIILLLPITVLLLLWAPAARELALLRYQALEEAA